MMDAFKELILWVLFGGFIENVEMDMGVHFDRLQEAHGLVVEINNRQSYG